MIVIEDKAECCGCSACVNICPKGCIPMRPDEEGFLYPKVDESKCVKCGKCASVCSFHADQLQRNVNKNDINYKKNQFSFPLTYAAKHKDVDARLNSRSGGVFSALSDEIFRKGGVVYGVVLDENFLAVHSRSKNVYERNKMRGSKYIQSDLRNTFSLVKQDLQKDKLVLFSGTSCQVMGLLSYLGGAHPRLLCIDIVCHGVCSPLIWEKYLNWQETKNKNKIIAVDFRNKKDFGWKEHIETLFLENGKKVSGKVFTSLFYSHIFLRPSCYQCPYKDTIHPADITLADYWGIDNAAPGFNDNKGVSLVLLNNNKGSQFFNEIKGILDIRQTRLEDSLQPALLKSFDCPRGRTKMWHLFNQLTFEKFIKKFIKHYERKKSLTKYKNLLKERIKCLLGKGSKIQ